MEMLLAGENPALHVLREQFAVSSLARREQTGVGFLCILMCPRRCRASALVTEST